MKRWCFLLLCYVSMVTAMATPQQTRYENLLKELRCLVCQNQDLLESHAPLANDLKFKVATLMRDGKTDLEIRQYLIQRYGEFVLFKPLIKPSTWALWFGPVIFLFMGLMGLGVWIWRSRQHE